MQKNLTLVMPKLMPTLATQPRNLPSLNKLLVRSEETKNPVATFVELIFALFTFPVTSELPVAAVTGLVDGLDTTHGFWLRADPVELRADLAALYLLGNDHFQLNPTEVSNLNQLLNKFLIDDDLILHTPHPKRWYLQSNKTTRIKTHAPAAVINKDVFSYLPYGEDQAYWRKLFTELQMVLHEKSLVNSLWFWGAGEFPQPTKTIWQKIWTDEITTQSLMQLNQIDLQTVPAHIFDCLTEIQTEGDYLLVIDSLPGAIEDNWFKPLVSALRKGKITKLRLYLGDENRYDITRKDIFRFWIK